MEGSGRRPIIEWFLPLFLSEVNKGRIGFERVVQLCSENPARLFSIYPRKGAILPGSDADLVIIDMKKEKTLSGDKDVHKVRLEPVRGKEGQGSPADDNSKRHRCNGELQHRNREGRIREVRLSRSRTELEATRQLMSRAA